MKSEPDSTGEQDRSLPPFITRGGDLIARPPFMQQGTYMRSFLIHADEERLQALCDETFNRPSEGKLNFRPLSGAVFLTFAEIKNIYSMYAQDQALGSMFEIDVAFWIPLLSEKNGRVHVSWYIPYIFVDNPFAMATGREVYGFPKTIGTFKIPPAVDSPDSYRVETMAMEHFEAGARIRPVEAIEVRRTAAASDGTHPVRSLRALAGMLFGDIHPFSTQAAVGYSTFVNFIRHRQLFMLFLRQLRSVAHPDRADFIEVLEAPSTVSEVRKGGLIPGEFELCLHSTATFPMAEDLGLKEGAQPVQAAFWVDFDFDVGLGESLWRTGRN